MIGKGTLNFPFGQADTSWTQPAANPTVGRGQGMPFPTGPGYVQQVKGLGNADPRAHYHRVTPGASRTDKDYLQGRTIRPRGLRGLMGRRLGQASASTDTQLGTGFLAVVSIVGASAGGAAIGYISEGSPRGAATGALFAGGLASLSDTALFAREGNTPGAILMGAAGILGIATSFYRFNEIRPAGRGGGGKKRGTI